MGVMEIAAETSSNDNPQALEHVLFAGTVNDLLIPFNLIELNPVIANLKNLGSYGAQDAYDGAFVARQPFDLLMTIVLFEDDGAM